jgi:phytoene dehydrogenase-like protein
MDASKTPQVLIVGAGLAGLSCARVLHRAGVSFTVLEASDAVGGRVRTDLVDGFRLDRGFQVFLPAYPEARAVLDYHELRLKRFYRGAEVMLQGKRCRIADPLQHPLDALPRLFCDLTPLGEVWQTILLKRETMGLDAIPRQGPELETEDYLESLGFSESFVNHFFRPFFGGVFLEKDLRTSSRMFRFLFSMFDQDGAAIPEEGMQAIPEQLASQLPGASVRLQTPVDSLDGTAITLPSGERLEAGHVVLAVDERTAARLRKEESMPKPARSTTCLYFATDADVPKTPILYLDGDGHGPVTNATVLSRVNPDCAPHGQHLISASVIGSAAGPELERVVRDQLERWFGSGVGDWRHLRTYTIAEAQPEDPQLHLADEEPDPVIGEGLYRCGDYCQDVSINGAMISGRRAAEAVLRAL